MREPVTPTRPSAPETPAGLGAERSPREEHPRKGLTKPERAGAIMAAEPPSRRAAEPPSRRAAEPPSRRAAEPPSRRAAEPPAMSPSGAWRRRARRPSSPPDAPAGRGLASRRRALSSDRPGPRAARSLRRVLASALLALALLAGLPAGAQAQPTVGFSASTASVWEDAGSIDLTLTLSPAQATDVEVIVKTVPNTASHPRHLAPAVVGDGGGHHRQHAHHP